MRIRPIGLVAVLTVAVMTVVSPAPATAGPADLSPYVPPSSATLKGGVGLQVDEAHGHVFIAQRNDGLLATDLDGHPVETIALPGRQTELSMSDDGSAVFALVSDVFGTAQSSTNTIYRIDTSTLQAEPVVDDEGLENGCTFGSVVQQAGLLWFSKACGGEGSSNDFGYVDPGDGSITNVGSLSSADIDRIVAVPGRTDRLIVLGGYDVHLFELGSGDPVTATEIASEPHIPFSTTAGVAPDGSEVVVAFRGGATRYSTDDLAARGQYNAPHEITSAAIRADGTVALGTDDPDLLLYHPDDASSYRTYDLDTRTGSAHAAGTVAWGDERLYAILGLTRLFAFTPRLAASVSIAVDKSHYRYGADVPIVVRLNSPSPLRSVVVWSVDRHGTRRKVVEALVPSGAPLRATAVARRTGTFEVDYVGDDGVDPAVAESSRVYVQAKVKSVMRSGRLVHGVRVHRLSEPAVIAARILPNHAGECIVFDVDVSVRGHWHDALGKCVRAGSNSAAALGLKGAREIVGYEFRARAIFHGDRDNEAAVGQWHYFRFVR